MITTYTYDPAGNRTRLNVDGALTTYAYDAGNRLRRSQEVAGITTFTFDNNGNQRSLRTPAGDITTFSWTYENQLKRVEDADGVLTTYTWAPVNRNGVQLRIAQETEDVFTNYLWDDQRLLMETDEVGAVEAEYTLQPQAHGPLVSQRRDGDSSFYAFDALGSTGALTDDTQAVTDQYTYKPFGEVRSSSGTTQNPFLWKGRYDLYADTDSGFYTLGRAQYAANLGRMITPVGDNGGGNQYAVDNPIQGGEEVAPGIRLVDEIPYGRVVPIDLGDVSCIHEPVIDEPALTKRDKSDVISFGDALAAFPCIFDQWMDLYEVLHPEVRGMRGSSEATISLDPPSLFQPHRPLDPPTLNTPQIDPWTDPTWENPSFGSLNKWLRGFKSQLMPGDLWPDAMFDHLLHAGSADAQWAMLAELEKSCLQQEWWEEELARRKTMREWQLQQDWNAGICHDSFVENGTPEDKVRLAMGMALTILKNSNLCPDIYLSVLKSPWFGALIAGWLICHATPFVIACGIADALAGAIIVGAAGAELISFLSDIKELAHLIGIAKHCCELEDAAEILARRICLLPADALLAAGTPSAIGRMGGSGTRPVNPVTNPSPTIRPRTPNPGQFPDVPWPGRGLPGPRRNPRGPGWGPPEYIAPLRPGGVRNPPNIRPPRTADPVVPGRGIPSNPGFTRPPGGRTVPPASASPVPSRTIPPVPKNWFGPYWRSENTNSAGCIESSGQLYGFPPTNMFHGTTPTVQAYPGPLPPGVCGIEFYTNVPGSSVPVFGGQVWWRGQIGVEPYVIKVIVTKNTTGTCQPGNP